MSDKIKHLECSVKGSSNLVEKVKLLAIRKANITSINSPESEEFHIKFDVRADEPKNIDSLIKRGKADFWISNL